MRRDAKRFLKKCPHSLLKEQVGEILLVLPNNRA
jgi:hypothetical protein